MKSGQNELNLYPYQRKGADHAIAHPRLIIADEPGLGKSAQALVAAGSFDMRVVIVCPASIKINWEREIEMWSPQIKDRTTIHSWAKVPTMSKKEPFILILDESHFCKNIQSKRSKQALSLSRQASRLICLTGTPILNRPIEIFPLLKMLQHPLGEDWYFFAKRYCRLRQTPWGLDASGSQNLDELKSLLGNKFLRRTREEVLPDLPEKTRDLRLIEPIGSLKLLVDSESASLKDSESRKVSFEKIALIRKQLALSKVDRCIEEALELLGEVNKLVVFWHHTEPLYIMLDALKRAEIASVALTGSMDAKERQEAIDSFQKGSSRVILLTLGAGSEGITLTAAHTMLMCEVDWTPARMIQAESRCQRIGQKNSVYIRYIVIEGTLDAHIAKTMMAKGANIGRVFEGERVVI